MIEEKVNNFPELKEIIEEARNVSLEKAYTPKSIRENYSVSINKEEGKIYISKK